MENNKIYKLSNFLENIDNISKEKEKKDKNQAIGKIVESLQQPFKNLLNSICENQIKEVERLRKQLKWK